MENLQELVQGRKLNTYQRGLAIQEFDKIKEVVSKWYDLREKVGTCYGEYDDDGNELKTEYENEFGSEPDLCTIGEIAAHALGFL